MGGQVLGEIKYQSWQGILMFSFLNSRRAVVGVLCSVLSICHAQFGLAQTIGLNFTGTNISLSGFVPPDTMGTVGGNHIVEMVNGRFNVYDKTTGASLATSTLNQFWSNAGSPHSGSFAFDPRVQYDPSSSRYYATSVDNAGGANNILFAVSKTSNPLDGWSGFKIDSDTDNLQWADFPQMGFSNDAIVISNNMFSTGGGSPFQQNILILPKADLLGAIPSVANRTLLENQYAATGNGFSFQSAMDLQNSGRPLRLFSKESAAGNTISAIQIDGTPNSPVVNNIADLTGLTPYAAAPNADQPGAKPNLHTGGNRTRSELTLINNDYYGIHSVQDPVSLNAALQWYRLDGDTLAIEAQGLIADTDLDLIYGSISANEFGDIVIGCTGSSENQFASSYAIVGDTDILGNVTFGNLLLLKAGVSDYQRVDGFGRNRWGDYSSTVLDPNNHFSFWTFQEFVSSTDSWSIQISQININAIPEPNSLVLVGIPALLFATQRRRRRRKQRA